MPKTSPTGVRRGVPWLYDNELVMDRRTKALAPGTVAMLEDANRAPLALVAFNPASRIAARVLDLDTDATIDRVWLTARLRRALELRETLFDTPYYRLVHAEADGMPGTIIDRFGDTCVIQPNAAWAEVLLDDLAAAVTEVTGVANVLKNASGRARSLEGMDDASAVLIGAAPDAAVPVQMNGATYMADLIGGQKTGIFYDQRPNHAFAARLSKGARVLDVFSHVGGYSLAALAHGASSSLAIDGSEPALILAQDGAAAMGKEALLETRRGDAFDVLEALGAEGAQFDIVICDPPAFAPSKKALEAGLRAYERTARLAAPLVQTGGYLALCSCSHAADMEAFRRACMRGIGRGLHGSGRSSQLIHTGGAGPDHPLHPHLAETGYLKALFFRL
jgi:23S rRNA (cytosine1962-C5)-methyltransferase